MSRMLIRYKTKPEKIRDNEQLIEQVFQELHATKPDGVRYLALKLDDGTFIHVVSVEEGAVAPSALKSFRTFRQGIEERCTELPRQHEATTIGDYRMLSS